MCWNTLISTTPKEAGVLLYQLPYPIWCQPLISANSNLIDAALFSGLLLCFHHTHLLDYKFKSRWIITSDFFLFSSFLSIYSLFLSSQVSGKPPNFHNTHTKKGENYLLQIIILSLIKQTKKLKLHYFPTLEIGKLTV